MKDDEVLLSFKRRECTVDIEGPTNVVTRIVPLGYPDTAGWMLAPPVQLVDPSRYRAVDVGRAQLMISTVAGRFGANHYTALVPLEVLKLQLSVNPSNQIIQPGDVVDVSVTIHNSSDPFARTSSTVTSGAVSSITTRDGLDFVISSQTSPETFPIVVKFEPTIKRGLMLGPNAPDRLVVATIQAESLSISALPFCLEAGQGHQFTAAISPGEDSAWPAWSTDLGSSKSGDASILDIMPFSQSCSTPLSIATATGSLMINYPREEAGPAIGLTFDPPWGLGHGESKGVGSISAEASPGLATNLTRMLSSGNVSGTYWLNRDYVNVHLSGEFSRSENGQVVENQIVVIRARARLVMRYTRPVLDPMRPCPVGA